MKKSVILMFLLMIILSINVSAEDNVKYEEDYFLLSGEIYNLRNDRGIEMYFDASVNLTSLENNIFVS